jgi:FkbM family methyltransferase
MLIEFDKIKDYGIVPSGVIHVGMHKAEEYPIYKNAGVEHIIFIEANPYLVEAVQTTAIGFNSHIVNAAVSDVRESVQFNITNNGESSSILELGDHSSIYPHIYNVETITLETKTLDDIMVSLVRNGKIPPFSYYDYNILNLDIQGAELKAMKGLSKWDAIDAVFTEVNYREMYKGCALIGEVEEFLSNKGFTKVEEVDTGCGWGDALFVRRCYV